jgi:hypothetical protein
MHRLARIEMLILALTALAVVAALALGGVRPLGIALAGAAAWLDFVLIRQLGTAVLIRRPPLSWLVPLALTKSLLLLLIPSAALLLPAGPVDGLSFAVGVSALPLAIVIDATLPLPAAAIPEES